MFSKILIANRGEIAVRIMRTARRLGIKTVAVYSEADEGSLHIEMADQAVAIGPAPAAQSYLVAERIVEAARRTGAQAVHPGFGFLAENSGFARALEAAGIVFIGPTPDAIAAMGDKIESKRLAQRAGVSTVPGYVGEVASRREAVRIAAEIGYPVMIKASAGGGGKGMRIARTEQEVAEGMRSAMSEAKSSFGDERVFVERFIERPRHIEIQVLGDAHGNVIHLGERECSVQRRHQKVIEEAPSPFLDETMRQAMGSQAVALAKAVAYRSAGTVEFIVAPDRSFYFLEMNTRLQVEHAVTEMVTGLDLVEEMIRVAAGERLRLRQEDVALTGSAIEARLYAEDPSRNFVPSTGRLVRYRPPPEGERLRIDSGVVEGSEISMYYDPMIAKLITYGDTRAEAIDGMADALDAFYVRGISHNLAFLNAVVTSDRFRSGDLSTGFIAEEFPHGFDPAALTSAHIDRLVPVLAAMHQRRVERQETVTGGLPGRLHAPSAEWSVLLGDVAYPVTTEPLDGGYGVTVGERRHRVLSDWEPGQPVFEGTLDGERTTVQVDGLGTAYRLAYRGAVIAGRVLTPRAAELAALMPVKVPPDTSKQLKSPMPGLLVAVPVEVGWDVKAGQELAVVEAMKMENVLRAEQDGVVKVIHVQPGESLAADQVILEFE